MWYFNGQIIKHPKAMVISGITHPRQIFRDSDTLTSLGIKPYREVTQDSRYYWNGAYTVDESGDEVVGTYAGTARDVDSLKASMLDTINSQVASKQGDIDFLSNGVKARTTNNPNVDTNTYIYIAFAETPFKYSNAR